MSKVKKENDRDQTGKEQGTYDEQFAYKSVIRSVVFAGIFLIISILFNGEIVTLFSDNGTILYAFGIVLKVLVILLFFVFMMISIGNYKELTGRPSDFKITLLVFIFSLAQGFRNVIVLSFSFIGLIFLLVYMYLIQEN